MRHEKKKILAACSCCASPVNTGDGIITHARKPNARITWRNSRRIVRDAGWKEVRVRKGHKQARTVAG